MFLMSEISANILKIYTNIFTLLELEMVNFVLFYYFYFILVSFSILDLGLGFSVTSHITTIQSCVIIENGKKV